MVVTSYLNDKREKTPRDYQADNLTQTRKAHSKGLRRVLTNASVGAGKTLMIAELIRAIMSRWQKRDENHYAVLCLARQGELIEQNSECAWGQGVKSSIWSASLGVKSKAHNVIFSTEKSFFNAMNEEFAGVIFDYLIIDECHQVPIDDEETQYMLIINELLKRNPNMFIAGYTGSPYRGINGIVGEFWQEQIQDVSTEYLIERGFLVPPIFGFPSDDLHKYNFDSAVSDAKITREGEKYFTIDESKLAKISTQNPTLTHEIMAEVTAICSHRKGGVLIFCASKKHCDQAAEILPPGSYGVITDNTPYKERAKIIEGARSGKIKYVLNLQCLTTGVDVPMWDTVVYLRTVGTISLLIQSMGRVLRLCDDIGKSDALVLDYAGVMERMSSIFDSRFIAEALKKKAETDTETFTCSCGEENSIYARRCYNCKKWFVKPEVCKCGYENDPTARECKDCGEVLIDWNEALYNKHYTDNEMKKVLDMNLAIDGDKLLVSYIVEGEHQPPPEVFYPWSKQEFCKKMFRVNFLQKHIQSWPMIKKFEKFNGQTMIKMKAMLDKPVRVGWRTSPKSNKTIFKKTFISGRSETSND